MDKVPEIFREACRRGVFIQGEVDPNCWHIAHGAEAKGKLRRGSEAFQILWFLADSGEVRCQYTWTSHKTQKTFAADDIEIVFSKPPTAEASARKPRKPLTRGQERFREGYW